MSVTKKDQSKQIEKNKQVKNEQVMKKQVLQINQVQQNERIRKQQESKQRFKQIKQKINGFNLKKLNLILFETSKQSGSILNEQQQNSIMLSTIGCLMGLMAGTTINVVQVVLKPAPIKARALMGLGGLCLLSSIGFTAYGMYSVGKIYGNHGQGEWQRIEKEDAEFNKLQWKQKKEVLMQRVKQAQQQRKRVLLEQQRRKKEERQQRVELVK